MLLVWLCFWAYFEFKSFKVFMWRRFGVEKIKIRDEKLCIAAVSFQHETVRRGEVNGNIAESISLGEKLAEQLR